MYEILVSHEADKQYKRQDKDTKRRLNKCIDELSKDPLSGSHIKKLHGDLKGKYRYRMGDIRIVYAVNVKSKTVEIVSIKSRGDVYKR
ncbi:MAG: type II toxin-antitoxin system RelE/ParE family toxin [Nitrospirota bacterium]